MLVYNMSLRIITKLFCLLLFTSTLFSIERTPDAFNYSKVDEQLDSLVSKDIVLIDHKGNNVKLDKFITNKPIVINFAYYTCPKLCHLITDSLTNLISLYSEKKLSEIQILTISFDNRDTITTLNAFRDKYLSKLNDNERENVNWDFLIGDEENIKKLTKNVGYNFYFNSKSEQYSHPSVLIFLGPSGKITRYLYGIVFDLFDFKLSLFESKKNKSLSTVESMLLFCYNYDPDEKGYVLEAVRLMKFGGILTVLFLCTFIYKLSRND